jgi:RNA polymerase sigma factor (TIGR02999 family)
MRAEGTVSGDAEPELTRLLHEWSSGKPEALGRLMEIVYPELRQIAAKRLSRERRNHTLQPTALVNEAYLRLAQRAGTPWQGRTHFFAVAARIVRSVLVDHARARLAAKRGFNPVVVELAESDAGVPPPPVDLLDLDAALTALERLDPQQSRVVELRHFGGLSIEETAEVLRVSPSTVKRDWLVAKTWIRRHMSGHAGGHDA